MNANTIKHVADAAGASSVFFFLVSFFVGEKWQVIFMPLTALLFASIVILYVTTEVIKRRAVSELQKARAAWDLYPRTSGKSQALVYFGLGRRDVLSCTQEQLTNLLVCAQMFDHQMHPSDNHPDKL